MERLTGKPTTNRTNSTSKQPTSNSVKNIKSTSNSKPAFGASGKKDNAK